jgi:hypothetical protein
VKRRRSTVSNRVKRLAKSLESFKDFEDVPRYYHARRKLWRDRATGFVRLVRVMQEKGFDIDIR